MASPLCQYDFTIKADGLTYTDLVAIAKTIFKKWVFQLEQGESSGYLHYQGRGSLIKRRRLPEAIALFTKAGLTGFHLSPTSNGNGDSFAYVMKLDTRVEGPWSDQDKEPAYIPRQYRDIAPYPFQQSIIDSLNTFDSRTINCVVDLKGCQGKTTIGCICCLMHNGIRLPPVDDSKLLLASVCDILTAKKERSPGPIFVDLPRSFAYAKQREIFSAIEDIKNGHVQDLRYRHTEWWFDSPPVWVFMNQPPDSSCLTRDRWKLWTIDPDHRLVPIVPVG